MKQSEALDMITKIQLAHQAMESACKRVDELKEENKNLKEALAKQEQGEPKRKWEGQIDNDEFFEFLKQEQGEPVAWMLEQGPHVEFEHMDYHDGVEWTPLYTTPQQRKPLSSYINSAKINATDFPHIVVEKLEKAIEAAHGIKEKNT